MGDIFKMMDGTPKTPEKLLANLLKHANEFEKFETKERSADYREGFKKGVQSMYNTSKIFYK